MAEGVGVFLLYCLPTVWCERGDSNPHGFTRQILSLVRLPIPPLSHVEKQANPSWHWLASYDPDTTSLDGNVRRMQFLHRETGPRSSKDRITIMSRSLRPKKAFLEEFSY